jgi:small subunit ribosomal protein S4
MLVNKGDVVAFRGGSRGKEEYKAIVEYNKNKTVPGWLEVNSDNMAAKVLSFPKREDVSIPVEEHLVVELYSR